MTSIVDTHVHLWDPARFRYPWLADSEKLNRPYLPADYRRATEGRVLDKIVFVQCETEPDQAPGEVAWVTGLAREEPRIQGIVAYAPVEQGEAVIPCLEELAENRLVRGVRRITQFEEDPAFCLQPDFVRGVRSLSEPGLTFDICLKGDEQMCNALQLVDRCPAVPFILDHIGKPFIKEGIFDPWAALVRALAERPNVVCKISGVATEANAEVWSPADLRPYLDHVIECFGFDRVLFGGDWPVCTLATTYRRWVETLEWTVEGCTTEEKAKLFHDNAVQFYRLAH